jgi:Ser/Thr protein kinase RdoA (MazF antagonist)
VQRMDDTSPSAAARHEAYAKAALTAYGLPASARARMISLSENATFLVETDHPVGVLRVYRVGYQSEAAIRSELAWIEALREDGIVHTPGIRRTTGGETLQWITVDAVTRACAMFDHVPGTAPTDDDFATYALVGRTAAELHRQTDRWQRPGWFTRSTWDVEHILGPDAPWGRWSDGPGLDADAIAQLERSAAVVRARLADYPARAPIAGLVHCDLRAANLLKGADNRVWVIDFDDAGFSWYLWDLCSSTTFIEHQPQLADVIEAWLTGYREVRALTDRDLEAIPDLVFLRRLHILAWLGSHPESDLAHALGDSFAHDTVELAERYLRGRFLPGYRPSAHDHCPSRTAPR